MHQNKNNQLKQTFIACDSYSNCRKPSKALKMRFAVAQFQTLKIENKLLETQRLT